MIESLLSLVLESTLAWLLELINNDEEANDAAGIKMFEHVEGIKANRF